METNLLARAFQKDLLSLRREDAIFSPEDASQPLIAPPHGGWRVLWLSEDPEYGGTGTAIFDIKRLAVPGHALVVLGPGGNVFEFMPHIF